MIDGNTYAIDDYFDEREDWNPLEEADALIEELQLDLLYEANLAQQAKDDLKEMEEKVLDLLSENAKLAQMWKDACDHNHDLEGRIASLERRLKLWVPHTIAEWTPR